MPSSLEEELAESHGERCQRVTAVTVALFDRQGAKYTDFPDTVAKSYAVLRSLISQDGNQLDNALFNNYVLFVCFTGVGSRGCHGTLVEVRRNRSPVNINRTACMSELYPSNTWVLGPNSGPHVASTLTH